MLQKMDSPVYDNQLQDLKGTWNINLYYFKSNAIYILAPRTFCIFNNRTSNRT